MRIRLNHTEKLALNVKPETLRNDVERGLTRLIEGISKAPKGNLPEDAVSSALRPSIEQTLRWDKPLSEPANIYQKLRRNSDMIHDLSRLRGSLGEVQVPLNSAQDLSVRWSPKISQVRPHELAHYYRADKFRDPTWKTYRAFRPWLDEEFIAGYLSGKRVPLDAASGARRKTSVLRGLYEGLQQRYAHTPQWTDEPNSLFRKAGRGAIRRSNQQLASLMKAGRPVANAVGEAEWRARRAARSAVDASKAPIRRVGRKLNQAGQRIGRRYWDEALEAAPRYADDVLQAGRRAGGKATRVARTGGRVANRVLPWVDAGMAAWGAGQGLARPELATRNIEQGGAIGNVARSVFDPVTMGRNAGGLVGTAARGAVNPVRGAQTLGKLPQEFYRYWSDPQHGGYAGQAGDWLGRQAYHRVNPVKALESAKRLVTDFDSTRLGNWLGYGD